MEYSGLAKEHILSDHEEFEADVLSAGEENRDRKDSVHVEHDFGGADDIFGAGSQRRDNGRVATVVLMANILLGSGVLNQAQVFQESGIAAATVMYLLTAGATWAGLVLVVAAMEETILQSIRRKIPRGKTQGGIRIHPPEDELDYTALAATLYGERGAALVDASIIFEGLGGTSTYILLLGGLSADVMQSLTGSESIMLSFYVLVPLMTAILILPPCLVRHLSNMFALAIVSAICVFIIATAVATTSWYFADKTDDDDVHAGLRWWSWSGMFQKAGSISYAMLCAFGTFHAYLSMTPKYRNLKDFKKVAAATVLYGLAVLYVSGLAGYLAFRDATNGNILYNFSGAGQIVLEIIVVVHLIIYLPNEFITMRHASYSIIESDVMTASFVSVFVFTASALTIVVIFVLALKVAGVAEGDAYGYLLDIVGGVSGSTLSFIFPAALFLKAFPALSSNINRTPGVIDKDQLVTTTGTTTVSGDRSSSSSGVGDGQHRRRPSMLEGDYDSAMYRGVAYALLCFGCASFVLILSASLYDFCT